MNDFLMIPLLVSFFSIGLFSGILIESRLQKRERVRIELPRLEDDGK